VIDGIDTACEAGLDPVKVNCVVIRGINDDQAVDFARFARERGLQTRFIEFICRSITARSGGGDMVVPEKL
jgi:cyclic pyranopterin phosphate synthase